MASAWGNSWASAWGSSWGAIVAAAAPSVRKGGAAGKKHRRRRTIILPPNEDRRVVAADERKPLDLAIQRIYVDATTPKYTKPQMADVDALIAKMSEIRPAIMPGVKRPDFDEEEDEDEVWLLMH